MFDEERVLFNYFGKRGWEVGDGDDKIWRVMGNVGYEGGKNGGSSEVFLIFVFW